MATPIRYDDLYMHGKKNQTLTVNVKKFLFDNNIAFNDLVYTDDNKAETIAALSTWFEDTAGNKIIFSDLPILTYDEIYWESEDKALKYAVRKYALQVSDLPSDFTTLAVKNS